MSPYFDNYQFHDILGANGFCNNILETMFGNALNWDDISKININTDGANFWVWNHHSHCASIASSVYALINRDSNPDHSWIG